MSDVTTLPTKEKILQETTTSPKENECVVKATETLRTTLPTKSGTDGSYNHFNHYNLDTIVMLDMMRVVTFQRNQDVARSIEIMKLLSSSAGSPEWFVHRRGPNVQKDADDFKPKSVDVTECLDVFNELSCAELGWS
jgi:hypothetical protein